MKTTRTNLCVFLLCGMVAAWGLAPPAQAYLDPGTGNALVQGLIGSVAVALGLIAHYWRRIRDLLPGGGRSSEPSPREQTRE